MNPVDDYFKAQATLPLYPGVERAPIFYFRAVVKDDIDDLANAFLQRPDLCLVPKRATYKLYLDGRYRACATRALVAYAMSVEIPRYGYGPTTCLCGGCVNPAHQTPYEPRT